MEPSFSCLFGLQVCDGLDAAQKVGELVGWFEILGLGGVIFALSEFIEKSKVRTYIFKYTFCSKLLFWLFVGAIAAVVFANVLPFIPGKAIVVIGYPASWEFLSLALITFFLLIFVGISFKTDWFIPRLKAKNLDTFRRIFEKALYEDKTPESIAAAAHILEGKKQKNGASENLRSLIELAASGEREERRESLYAQHIIQHILSDRDYTRYLATENLPQTYEWFEHATEFKLWKRNASFFFFQSLTGALYEEKNSWLGREEEYTGMGIGKSLHQLLFKTLEGLGGFQLFGNFLCKDDPNEYQVLRRKLNGLLMSLEEYYESSDLQFSSSNPTDVLNAAVRLGHSHGWYKLPENSSEIWEHPLRKSVDAVDHFYHDLRNIIEGHSTQQDLSDFEGEVQKDSVAEGIVEGIFEFLEELSTIKNIEFARHPSCSVFWVIFSPEKPITMNMEKKLLPMIEERIKHNLEGAFHSMIRLLIEIYGFAFYSKSPRYSIIGGHVKQVFLSTIAPRCIAEPDFAADHLPPSWVVEDGKIISKGRSKVECDRQMYPAPTE
jgi:hypothetical protein